MVIIILKLTYQKSEKENITMNYYDFITKVK